RWPHNVRELVQRLQRALVLSSAEPMTPEDLGLPREVTPGLENAGAPRLGARHTLSPADAALHRELVAPLRQHRGNIPAVARQMQKARMQIQRWMKRLGIDPAEFRPS